MAKIKKSAQNKLLKEADKLALYTQELIPEQEDMPEIIFDTLKKKITDKTDLAAEKFIFYLLGTSHLYNAFEIKELSFTERPLSKMLDIMFELNGPSDVSLSKKITKCLNEFYPVSTSDIDLYNNAIECVTKIYGIIKNVLDNDKAYDLAEDIIIAIKLGFSRYRFKTLELAIENIKGMKDMYEFYISLVEQLPRFYDLLCEIQEILEERRR